MRESVVNERAERHLMTLVIVLCVSGHCLTCSMSIVSVGTMRDSVLPTIAFLFVVNDTVSCVQVTCLYYDDRCDHCYVCDLGPFARDGADSPAGFVYVSQINLKYGDLCLLWERTAQVRYNLNGQQETD